MSNEIINENNNINNGLSYYNQALFESMAYIADAVWSIDVDKDTVNIMHDRLTKDMQGKNFPLGHILDYVLKKVHPNEIEEAKRILSRHFLCNLDEILKAELRVQINNEYHTLRTVTTPQKDDEGNVKFVYITIQDVQKYLDNNEERKKMKKELEIYLSSVSCGILQCALDTNEIIYVNDRALEILGYKSAEEMQADGFDGIAGTVAPEDAGILKRIVSQLKDSGSSEAVECEYSVVHKDGKEVTCFGTIRLIENSDNRLIIQRSMIDISDARRNGKLYKETTDILAGANMGLWFMVLDDGAPRFIIDENMADLVGLKESLNEEETYDFWYNRVDKQYKPQVAVCVSLIKSGQPCEIIYPYHHPVRGTIMIRCGGSIDKNYAGEGVMIHGYHQDITEYNEKLLEKESINRSMTNIYDTMHLVDIEEDTFEELGATEVVHDYLVDHKIEGARANIWGVLKERICEAHYENIKNFTDLTTLSKRMQGKNFIQMDAINAANNWYRFGFIRIGEKDEELKSVLFVSQNIDESKRREERLVRISNTDGLTGIFNRHAYENNVGSIQKKDVGKDLWFISADVNLLKKANDLIGHHAGDEIICGTANCLKHAFKTCGDAYRIGGDEFLVVARGTDKTIKKSLDKLEKLRQNWKGKYVDALSFAIGVVCSSEIENCTIDMLERISDERMYSAKNEDKK